MRLLKQAVLRAALMFLAVPILASLGALAQEVFIVAVTAVDPSILSQLLVAVLPTL